METTANLDTTPSANSVQTDVLTTVPKLTEPADAAPARIQEILEAVYRLFKYATADASRNLSQQMIEQIVPLLQKKATQFTPADEIVLWSIYNQLSVLVAPATNESLWLKEQIEHDDRAQIAGVTGDYSFTAKAYKKIYASVQLIGATCCLIFFLLQGYTVALSDSLERVGSYYVELVKVEEQILATKQAKPNIGQCEPPLSELNKHKDQLLFKIDNHYQMMEKLSRAFWGYLYSNKTIDHYKARSPQCREETIIPYATPEFPPAHDEQNARAERVTFFEGAKSTLRICNYLMLPFILGTLGSVAYVIRSILDSFYRASLTIGSNRSGGIRVYLGGVLGLLSGVIIVPDIKEIQQVSYAPLVWAFLMGYSVEFAFTFFDALIARGRKALLALRIAPTTPSQANPEDKEPEKK